MPFHYHSQRASDELFVSKIFQQQKQQQLSAGSRLCLARNSSDAEQRNFTCHQAHRRDRPVQKDDNFNYSTSLFEETQAGQSEELEFICDTFPFTFPQWSGVSLSRSRTKPDQTQQQLYFYIIISVQSNYCLFIIFDGWMGWSFFWCDYSWNWLRGLIYLCVFGSFQDAANVTYPHQHHLTWPPPSPPSLPHWSAGLC